MYITQKPWVVSDYVEPDGSRAILAGNLDVCHCFAEGEYGEAKQHSGISKFERYANACLIAAAPSLYRALKAMILFTEHLNPCPGTLEDAKIALANARGV